MRILTDILNKAKIEAEGKRLGVLLAQRLPPEKLKDESKSSLEIATVFGHIQGYQRKEKLGVYGKAKLVNAFQWALIAQGYERQIALKLGRQITTRLTTKK